MSENSFNRFKKLPLGDERRPITVVETVDAEVPEPSKRFLDHKVDSVLFKNGKSGYHHRITTPEGIMIAHVDPADTTLALVDNYRHPLGRYSRELPSGGLDPEEKAEFEQADAETREILLKIAAAREAREEIGRQFDPSELTRMFKGPLQGSVGFADQTYHIFHAEGGSEAEEAHDDGEEGMLTHSRYHIDDVGEMIGYEIVDPATSVAALALINMYGHRLSSELRKMQNN